MSQIGRDIDDYMAKKSAKQKPTLRETIKQRFKGMHTTITNHEKQALEVSGPTEVTIVAPRPNVFRVLFLKMMRFFKGKS